MTDHVYPPPFGEEEDCICPDSWRRTRPRNHTERCEKAFEAKRSERRAADQCAAGTDSQAESRAVTPQEPGR